MTPGPWGRLVLRRHGTDGLLWRGQGASEEGARPFIDVRGWGDGARRRRLWRAACGCYEEPEAVLAAAQPGACEAAGGGEAGGGELLRLLTRRQTSTQPPQLIVRSVSAEAAAAADGGGADDASAT